MKPKVLVFLAMGEGSYCFQWSAAKLSNTYNKIATIVDVATLLLALYI